MASILAPLQPPIEALRGEGYAIDVPKVDEAAIVLAKMESAAVSSRVWG